MSLRSKHHRQDRLNRLHLMALKHISRQGVQGLSLGAVAKELGYTTAALYRYYPSRESLILELQKQTLAMLSESLDTILKKGESCLPLTKLILCAEYYTLYATNSPASFALNSSLFANPTPMLGQSERQETMMMVSGLLQTLSTLIKASKLSPISPPLSLAVGYWSTLYGALMTRKYSLDLTLLKPLELITTLCIGWGASTEQMSKAQQELESWKIQFQNQEMKKLTCLDHLNIPKT